MRSRPRPVRRGNDTANNKVYVHLFDDTAPPRDGTNLYLTSSGWGTVTINGDYLWLENLTIEHATPEGLRVNTSATGTVLKRITALATIVNLRGVNTLAEDLNVSHVIRQRTDPAECYDANPSFGVGECWNANGIGQALAIGVEGNNRLVRADRPPRLRPSLVERRGNRRSEHAGALQVLGLSQPHARRFGHGQRHPAQRLPERAGLDLSRARCLRRPHRRAQRASQRCALLGEQQRHVAACAPKSWRFRYNVVPAITYDDKTYLRSPPTATCSSLRRPRVTFLMKVTGTDGRPGFEYDTLAEIQANTALEDRLGRAADGEMDRRNVVPAVRESDRR